MTLKEHTDYCIALVNQGYGNLPVGYSKDSEGNAYYSVHYEPDLVLVKDVDSYKLELVEVKEGEEFEPNCVIIN